MQSPASGGNEHVSRLLCTLYRFLRSWMPAQSLLSELDRTGAFRRHCNLLKAFKLGEFQDSFELANKALEARMLAVKKLL